MVTGLAVVSLPITEVDGFLSNNAFSYSCAFASAWSTFYAVVIAFVLRTLVYLWADIRPEDEEALKFDTTGQIIVVLGMVAGIVWTLTCAWFASHSFINASQPWLEAYAEDMTEVAQQPSGTEDSGYVTKEDGSGGNLGTMVGELARIKELFDHDYLTTDEKNAAVADVKCKWGAERNTENSQETILGTTVEARLSSWLTTAPRPPG